ncbi:MAG: OmpA family protein [Candidatus Eisenbacteria sp.]|nr:OmpA family protein [Candidatus Eisenbacteria bacterium]
MSQTSRRYARGLLCTLVAFAILGPPLLGAISGCGSHRGWSTGTGGTFKTQAKRAPAVKRSVSRQSLAQQLLDMQMEELSKIAETSRTDNSLIVNSDKILFETNSTTLRPGGREILVNLADVLRKYPEDLILVAGHCDDTGTLEFNQQLSEERAMVVADILIDTGVLPLESIQVKGYGEDRPTAQNTTDEGRALNRRVELVISIDESMVQNW